MRRLVYAHIDQGRIFPITYDVGEVLEGYETLRRLATSPRHLVPGHDPLVLLRYPAPSPASKAGSHGSTWNRPKHNRADRRTSAAVEFVGFRKALWRQAAGVGAIAAPVGELLQRQREHAAGGIGPAQPLFRFEA